MARSWDLEIDTYWIRRAAGAVDEASVAFAAAGVDRLPAPLSAGCLGRSAAAVVALVNARIGQAHAAGAQLHAVAAGMGRQLVDVADHFDSIERAIAMPIR